MRTVALGLLFLLIATSPVLSAEAPAASPTTPEQIQRLIEALGHADYYVRQNAEAALARIGFDAVDALTAATEHDDLEIVMRANRLLYRIRSNWSLPGEPAGVVELLAGYELQDDGSREVRIARLINLPEYQGIPAVCRVIRYERSSRLAKTAALRLIEALDLEQGTESLEVGVGANIADSKPGTLRVAPSSALQVACSKGLGTCHRPPAQWVLARLQAGKNPQSLAAVWTQFTAEEEQLLFRRPRDTSLTIVESLLRLQIAALRKSGRGTDAAGSIERLIRLRSSRPAELAELLNWLIDQKDWPATRLLERVASPTIAESANLLYLVAEARARRGDAPAAEQAAAEALKLDPGDGESSLELHCQAGLNLELRGRFDWAAKELEHVLHSASPRSQIGIVTARSLAELYHDLEDNQRAAETLGVIETAHAGQPGQLPLLNSPGGDVVTLSMLRARKSYFEACHWKARGDRARQRDCLDKSLATQYHDIEVLIDCYQLPERRADYHAKIRGLIGKKLCELREQIADLGPNRAAAQPCNEFAWLAGNTIGLEQAAAHSNSEIERAAGNLDEALRFSKRSLELYGEDGAFCDTLAQVYFAQGDYANALRNQTRAAELSPYNREVQKHLALFRKKAEEKGIKLEKTQEIKKPAAPLVPLPPATDDPFG